MTLTGKNCLVDRLALAALIHSLRFSWPLAHAYCLNQLANSEAESGLAGASHKYAEDHLALSAREPIARHLKRYARDEHAAIRPHLLLELADELLCWYRSSAPKPTLRPNQAHTPCPIAQLLNAVRAHRIDLIKVEASVARLPHHLAEASPVQLVRLDRPHADSHPLQGSVEYRELGALHIKDKPVDARGTSPTMATRRRSCRVRHLPGRPSMRAHSGLRIETIPEWP